MVGLFSYLDIIVVCGYLNTEQFLGGMMRIAVTALLALSLCACTGLNRTRTASFYPADTLTSIPQIADIDVKVGQSDSIVVPIFSRAKGVPLIWPNVSNRLTRIKTYEVVAMDTLSAAYGSPWKYVLRLVGVARGVTTIILLPEGNEKDGTRSFRVWVDTPRLP
jgi:hypothetical protein